MKFLVRKTDTSMHFRIFIFTLVLFFVGTVLILVSTSLYGVGLSPDSVAYISTARSLSEGKGYSDYTGTPTTSWPPLFPTILALTKVTLKISPSDSARFINALAFGLIVALTNFILYTHLPTEHRRKWLTFGILVMLFSVPLLHVSVMAWSEPLFIVFNLLFLLNLYYYLESSKHCSRFLLASCVFAALACLTRYIGITSVIVGAVAILISNARPTRSKFVNAVFFSAISVFPLSVWLIHNWKVSNTLMGTRAPSNDSLLTNLYRARGTVFGWFLPEKLEPWYTAVMLGVLITVVVTALLLKSKNGIDGEVVSSILAHRGTTFLFLVALYVVVYSFFLIISATSTAFDGIDDRLLSPVYPGVVLILLIVLAKLSEQSRQRYSWSAVVIVFPMVIWSLFVVSKATWSVSGWLEHGAGGYATSTWHEREILKFLREEDQCSSLPVFSNRAEALYMLADITATRTPTKTYYNSDKIANDLENLRGRWPDTSLGCLVWFDNERSYQFSPEELAAIVPTALVCQFEDDRVYLLGQVLGSIDEISVRAILWDCYDISDGELP